MVEGIAYRYRTGVAWRDLPAAFGPWQTVWTWHHRLAAEGTWDLVLDRLLAEADAVDAIGLRRGFRFDHAAVAALLWGAVSTRYAMWRQRSVAPTGPAARGDITLFGIGAFAGGLSRVYAAGYLEQSDLPSLPTELSAMPALSSFERMALGTVSS